MGGFTLWGGGLDLASSLAELAMQWLAQSTLIIAAGLIVAALLRNRTPALRSVVYHTTLVAALACPAVAYLLSTFGLTFVAIELPSPRAERLEIYYEPAAQPEEPAPIVAQPVELREPQVPLDALETPALGESFAGPPSALAEPTPGRQEFPTAPETESQEVAEDPPALWQPSAPMEAKVRRVVSTRPVIAAVLLGVPTLWGLVSLVLLGRLLVDHWRLARLRRMAVPVDDVTRQVCQEVARRMNVSPPRLLHSPFVRSPCLSGIFVPTVLLPEDIVAEALPAVLVHELAHRKRGDCAWNLLRHVGVALLWVQPLVWRLSRQMEAAAEDVCDDYVVEFGESRTAYAETLVSIAHRNLLPASGAAVSLITFRSMLGQRVQRILDQSRRLTLTVGLAALMLIIVGGVSAALLAGLLGPAAPAGTAEAGKIDEPEEDASAAGGERGKDEQPRRITGRVVTPTGEAAPAADVLLLARRRESFVGGLLDQASQIEVLAQTKADADGRFDIPAEKLAEGPYLWVQILAKSRGFGLAWQDVNAAAEALEFSLQLPETRDARGRLVTAEGQPAAGIRIVVDKIGHTEPGRFEGVHSMRAQLPAEVWPQNVITDADGRFTVPGIPTDADLSLRIDQEPFAPRWWMWHSKEPTEHIEVLDPAQIITGVVVEADSGRPIPYANLTAYQDKTPNRSMTGIGGRADAKGRFRLNPFPASAFTVSAFAPRGVPYLARQFKFDWPATETEHEIRLEMPRGVLVEGRITEQRSGDPVAGAGVRYEPRRDNEFANDDLISGWSATVVTDNDGLYAIAVPRAPARCECFVQTTSMSFARQPSSSCTTVGQGAGGCIRTR